MKIEGLKNLVEPARRGCNRGLTPMLQMPWQINFSGVEYTLATDGKAMVILKNTTTDFQHGDSGWCARVLDILRAPVGGSKMALDRLKEWAGPAIWLHERPCEECKGTGAYCEGGEDCECEEDFHSAPEKCDDCGSTGRLATMPFRPGKLGKLLFNLNLVAAVLETASGGEVMVEVDEHRLTITADNWRAWIMSMPEYFKPEDVSRIPTLALS